MKLEGWLAMVRVLRVIVGTVLIMVGAAAFTVLVVPRLFGWHAYLVTSGSMVPTFSPGAVVVTAPVDPTKIAQDDIVTFLDASGEFTTHRVVGVTASSLGGEASLSFSTKGDANEDADPTQLEAQQVVGKAKFAVPHLGRLVSFVRTPVGGGLLAGIFLFMVFSGRSGKSPDEPASKSLSMIQREAVGSA